jgi:hypothetical protein
MDRIDENEDEQKIKRKNTSPREFSDDRPFQSTKRKGDPPNQGTK